MSLHERIDNLIREKAMGQPFSGICDDATFLRRVTLDLTGNIPTAGEEYEKPAEDGLPAVPKFRLRERLAKDLTAKENAGFIRNSVNRIWFLLMGRGLSHPLDQMHGKNPPSHPKLLELLAREFVSHDFDLKWLLHEIMLSEVCQRSSRVPEGANKVEPASYRVTSPKGLTPEQLLRALLRATGNLPLGRATPFNGMGACSPYVRPDDCNRTSSVATPRPCM